MGGRKVRDQMVNEEAGQERKILEEIPEDPRKGGILGDLGLLTEGIPEDLDLQTGGIPEGLPGGSLEGVFLEAPKIPIIQVPEDGSIQKIDIKEDVPDLVVETEADVTEVLKEGDNDPVLRKKGNQTSLLISGNEDRLLSTKARVDMIRT